MNEGMADCGKASNAMYSARGCRCAACRAAHLAAYHERIRRRSSGQKYFVEAGPVRAKLEHLYEIGYSIKELGRMGVPKSTQYALMHAHSRSGKPLTRVNREVAQRIDEIAGRALAPAQVVPGDAAAYLVRRWADSGTSALLPSRVKPGSTGKHWTPYDTAGENVSRPRPSRYYSSIGRYWTGFPLQSMAAFVRLGLDGLCSDVLITDTVGDSHGGLCMEQCGGLCHRPNPQTIRLPQGRQSVPLFHGRRSYCLPS